jgi:hypothetical protein
MGDWQRGRLHQFAKLKTPYGVHRFESCIIRHIEINMKIYRVENSKHLGPFWILPNWGYEPRICPWDGYSYRDYLRIMDNNFRFGVLDKEQFEYFKLSNILDNEFKLVSYFVPRKDIVFGVNDIAFHYFGDSTEYLGETILEDLPSGYE